MLCHHTAESPSCFPVFLCYNFSFCQVMSPPSRVTALCSSQAIFVNPVALHCCLLKEQVLRSDLQTMILRDPQTMRLFWVLSCPSLLTALAYWDWAVLQYLDLDVFFIFTSFFSFVNSCRRTSLFITHCLRLYTQVTQIFWKPIFIRSELSFSPSCCELILNIKFSLPLTSCILTPKRLTTITLC